MAIAIPPDCASIAVMLRWRRIVTPTVFFASVALASARFPLPPVMWDSFGDPIPGNLEPITWTGGVQIVEKSDPVFVGSDLSGVHGEYFGLLGKISVDVPTQPGVYHRVRYSFGGADFWGSPFTANLEVSANALLRTRESVDHHGNPVTVDDLALLRRARHLIPLPGIANWRIHEWKEGTLGFRATTPVTRIQFQNSDNGKVSLDHVIVLPGPKIDASVRLWSERNGRGRVEGSAKSDDGIRKVKVWVNSRKARTHGRERWIARVRFSPARKVAVRVIVIDKAGDTYRLGAIFLSKSR